MITDHSTELDDSECSEVLEHPEDNLTAILKAKDNQIRILQIGNVCFQKRAKYFESKAEDLEASLETACEQFAVINQVLSTAKYLSLAEAELIGIFKLLEAMTNEGEEGIKHDLAIANLPDVNNSESESEG